MIDGKTLYEQARERTNYFYTLSPPSWWSPPKWCSLWRGMQLAWEWAAARVTELENQRDAERKARAQAEKERDEAREALDVETTRRQKAEKRLAHFKQMTFAARWASAPVRAGKTGEVESFKIRENFADTEARIAAYCAGLRAGKTWLTSGRLVYSSLHKAAEAFTRPKRHGERWTRAEEESLLRRWRYPMSLSSIAQLHQRHPDAIVRRLAKLAGMPKSSLETEDQHISRARSIYFTGAGTSRASHANSNLNDPNFTPRFCE